jgi:hypothetical protein
MKKELAPESQVSENARIGHKRRLARPRGIKIDSKKSWAPPETFIGVRPHPNPNEGSY